MKKLILALIFFSGCTLPLKSKDIAAIVEQLKNDSASACFWVGARGGAGSVIPAPAGGGYGSAELLIGRANSPGSKLKVENGTCELEVRP